MSGGSPARVATSPSAVAVGTYTPVTGAIFNRPIGTVAEQRRIVTHVNRTIDSTPAGATIRIAVFSFSEKATADRLLAAKRRGVHVQVVVDDHTIYAQEARLRAALGRNPGATSFVVYCHLSCRGASGGNMHDKFFTFSRAGSAENVTMVGSDNLTGYNATRQWSDVYTVANDPALYFTYSGVFDQLKWDRGMARTYYQADIDGYQAQFYPYAVGRTADPVYQALSKIVCTGAAPGTGVAGNTLVRISQHAWNGTRGIYLAQKVDDLAAQGCVVQVIYGTGTAVLNIIERAGVAVSAGHHRGIRTHQNTLLVSGSFDGDPGAHVVFTGSHDWSDGALRRDETILRIENPAAYAQYATNFEDIWTNG